MEEEEILVDYDNECIRTKGNAKNTFVVHPYRMLEAIRLRCEHELGLEKETYLGIISNAYLIKYDNSPRKILELDRLLIMDHPSNGIDMLRNCLLLRHIFPTVDRMKNIPYKGQTLYDHVLEVMDLTSRIRTERLAALYHPIERTIGGYGFISRILNSASKTRFIGRKMEAELVPLGYDAPYVSKLVKIITMTSRLYSMGADLKRVSDKAVRRIATEAGDMETLQDLLDVIDADNQVDYPALINQVPLFRRKMETVDNLFVDKDKKSNTLPVNGKDIIQELGIKPGPQVSEYLAKASAYCAEHTDADRKSVIEYLKNNQ